MAEWRWNAGVDSDANQSPQSPRPPSASRALSAAFGTCYEYLGLTVAWSCLASLVFLPIADVALVAGREAVPRFTAIAAIRMLGRSALIICCAAVVGAALTSLAGKMLARDEPSFLDPLRGVAEKGGAALKLAALNTLIWWVLWADLCFFGGSPSPALRLVAIPVLYALLLWMASGLYQMPLVVLQGLSPGRAIKQGVLLALDNLVFTGVLAFAIIAVAGVSLATRLLLVLALPVWLAVAAATALRELIRKYEAMGASRQAPDV